MIWLKYGAGGRKMKLDATLLNMDGIPTDADMQAFFKAHDFTTAAPLIDRENISNEQAELRDKVRKLFQAEWLKRTEALGGKKLFVNFTNNYPLKKLADTDANLISDAILKISGDDELLDAYSESACQIIEKPLTEAVLAYAEKTGKDIHVISDEEIQTILAGIADDFLGQMVGLLQTAQRVPEILELTTENAAHEDFNSNVRKNLSEIDFKRKWDRDCKELGEKLSFELLTEADMADLTEDDPFEHLFAPTIPESEIQELKEKFIATLSEQDQKLLFLLREKKLKQNKIAERLGLKTQGAVSKRLKHLREQAQSFIKQELPDE